MDEIFSTEKLSRTSYRNAETVIEEIIGDLSSTDVDALNLIKDIKSHEEYLYTHSVNTGIITALFASKCGKYSHDEVKYVSLGAYLHDIGSTKIDKQLLNKQGKLNISEVQKVKRHPQLGYEILKGIDRISPIVLQSVLFHHEKYNNRGYYQLPYETLPEFPKMVSIADIYDAMTSDRPYRKATTPGHALKAIVNCINSHFDYDLISGFVNMLGPVLNQAQSFYRTGDICELNTQELAVIRDLGDRDLLRPKVWVFCKFVRQGNRLTVNYYRSPSLVSLQSDPARHITKIISDENQIATIKQKLDERKVL
jgi:HD-GYP domain-containing protein (c-di-GMP phosphodiesterase class II)